MADFKFTDHSDEVLSELKRRTEAALTVIGMQAEKHAKENAPVDTGRLRNSISSMVQDEKAYIGTNVSYAPYQEFGTYKMGGKHYLKRALEENMSEYKQIAEQALEA